MQNNGILNTGNISSGSVSISGNVVVANDLAVTGNSYLGSMIITSNTINANGNVISGVRDVVTVNDAVCLGQLNRLDNGLQNQIDDNQRESRSGIAANACIPSLEAGKQYNIAT